MSIESSNPTGLSQIIIFAIAAVVCSLPLVMAQHVPLGDYPFHLARISILDRYNSDPFLQSVYAVNLKPIPNIAMDVVAVGLAKVLPVEVAGRVFLILSFVLTIGGLAALHRVLHGRLSPWPIVIGSALLYNWVFVFGFVNYLFGLALLPWAISLWLVLLHRPLWLRLAVGTGVALTLFFFHLVAFVLFAVVLAGLTLQDSIIDGRLKIPELLRRAAIVCGVCVVPAAIYLFMSPTSQDLRGGFVFETVIGKLKAVLRTPLSTNLVADAIGWGGVLIFGAFAAWRGSIAFAARMKWAFWLLMIVFLLAPVGSKAGWHIDDRIPIAILLLATATFRFDLPDGRGARVTTAVVCAALAVRMVLITIDWVTWDQDFLLARRAFAAFKGDTILFVAETPNTSKGTRERNDYIRTRNLASYAGLEPGVFSPVVFAHPQLQPITIRSGLKSIADLQQFNAIRVVSSQDLVELKTKILAATANATPLFSTGYLLFLGSPETRMVAMQGEELMVHERDFDILRLW